MRIAILGPIGTASIAHLLDVPACTLPAGSLSAPVLSTLIESLLRRGHQVDAFTIAYGADLPSTGLRAQGPGFSVRFLPGRIRAFRFSGMRPGRALDACRVERRALVDALGQGSYDVVHAHWLYEYAAAALDQSAVPTVITAHDEPAKVLRHMTSLYRLLRFAMAMSVMRSAPQVTAVSPYLLSALARYRKGELHFVPNPLPDSVTRFPQQGRRLVAGGPLRLGVVLNGWSRLKNAKQALRAFQAIRSQLPPGSTLQMIGAGYAAGGPAQQWADCAGLAAGVQFLGELPHGAVLACIGQMHVLLNPSLEESFGVAIAEAMALGVPVVAGRTSGAVPWLLANGAAGTLVDVKSADSIALGLLDTVEALQAGGAAGCEFALHRARSLCNADSVAARYEAVYRRAAGMGGMQPALPLVADQIPPPQATVLHVLNELKASGAEVMLRNAGAEWVRHGIRCRVLSVGNQVGAYAPQLARAGYRVGHLPFAPTPAFAMQIVRHIRAIGPQVVHVHAERASFWMALAARLAGVPVVARTVHNNFAFAGTLRARRWLTRAATRLLGVRQIAISEGVHANELARFGNRTTLLHNWYDSHRFVCTSAADRAAARVRLALADEQRVLLTVGNCSAVKNHGALFEALAMLRDPRLVLLHAGAEETGCPERRLVQGLGLAAQVRFLGPTDPLPLLQAADLFVMPSLYEGFSIAALEACATGTPSLFADVPGLRDLALHFKAPMFCKPSAPALAESIARWLATDSCRLREQASADAALAQARFGMEEGVARYAALYALAAQVPAARSTAGTDADSAHKPMPARQ